MRANCEFTPVFNSQSWRVTVGAVLRPTCTHMKPFRAVRTSAEPMRATVSLECASMVCKTTFSRSHNQKSNIRILLFKYSSWSMYYEGHKYLVLTRSLISWGFWRCRQKHSTLVEHLVDSLAAPFSPVLSPHWDEVRVDALEAFSFHQASPFVGNIANSFGMSHPVWAFCVTDILLSIQVLAKRQSLLAGCPKKNFREHNVLRNRHCLKPKSRVACRCEHVPNPSKERTICTLNQNLHPESKQIRFLHKVHFCVFSTFGRFVLCKLDRVVFV